MSINWEGVGAQFGALLVVYGSYALARGLQLRRRRRAIRRTDSQDPAAPETPLPKTMWPPFCSDSASRMAAVNTAVAAV